MLHEISQTQKDKYYMIPLNEDSEIVKFKERESEIVVSGDRGKWEALVKVYKFSVIQGE